MFLPAFFLCLTLLFHDADLPYEEVRAFNDFLVETAALRAQSPVDNNRELRAAITAESNGLYPFDDEFRAPEEFVIIGDHLVPVLKELGYHGCGLTDLDHYSIDVIEAVLFYYFPDFIYNTVKKR